MDIDQVVAALEEDLARVVAVADETTRAAAERVVTALESSVRVRVIDLLGSLAADLSAQLSDAHVEVRLAGSEPELVVVPESAADADDIDEEQAARLTIRLPPRLKDRVDEAAAADGVSANTWVVRALRRAAASSGTGRIGTGGRRLRGYGRS